MIKEALEYFKEKTQPMKLDCAGSEFIYNSETAKYVRIAKEPIKSRQALTGARLSLISDFLNEKIEAVDGGYIYIKSYSEVELISGREENELEISRPAVINVNCNSDRLALLYRDIKLPVGEAIKYIKKYFIANEDREAVILLLSSVTYKDDGSFSVTDDGISQTVKTKSKSGINVIEERIKDFYVLKTQISFPELPTIEFKYMLRITNAMDVELCLVQTDLGVENEIVEQIKAFFKENNPEIAVIG